MYASRWLALILTAVMSCLGVAPARAPAGAAVSDHADTAEQLAASMVARMTLEEKLPQLLNVAPAIAHLNIPAYNWWTESLHGANGPLETTNFPEPIALGATFDATLVHDIAAAISEELRALHALARQTGHLGRIGTGLDTWSPNINIFRDPRWGRGQETYGEDPYLTATLGVAFVTGMQGPDPEHPQIIATPKHFAVHSGPESTRHKVDVRVSAHDLEDTYLPAFRAAIVEGHAGSIMCAYNSINGEPACANELLLQQRLRSDWGFKGYVVSDCDAVRDISEGHYFVANEPAAVAKAFKSGVTNECNTQLLDDLDAPLARYQDAVARGLLPEAVIDSALVRLFAARYRNGDLPGLASAARKTPKPEDILSPAHRALALRSAEEGMVLLKNEGLLPLKPESRLLVIGPLADATRVLRGNYSSALSGPPVSLLEGLHQALPHASISYLPSPASVTDGDPVPPAELQTPEGGPGLRVEYFNARGTLPSHFPSNEDRKRRLHAVEYEAGPVTSRVEPNVSARAPALPQVHDYYRAHWRGYLVPKQSGRYRLALGATTGTLTFEGKPLAVLDDVPWGTMPEYHPVDLHAGTRYAVEIDARGTPQLDLQLLWKRVAEQPADLRSAAAGIDAIVAVVGLTSDLEGEESKVEMPGFSGGDRTTLDLPADQQRLLEVAQSTGKPLIVVLMNGSALGLTWAKTHAAAILEAWYPGEAGGLVAARVLSGQVNPSGRLPITFYRDVTELPAFEDYSMRNRTYRYYTGVPVFPFGYGLSYTRFEYGGLGVKPQGTQRDEAALDVSVQVRNTGPRAGEDVAQLYLRFPNSPTTPRLALRGFQRVSLEPGAQKTLHFSLSRRDLSCVSAEGFRRIVAGEYGVVVGSGMPGSGASTSEATFSRQADERLPF